MKTVSAQCASEIRKELKSVFPHIKFSIRSENYAGGDAVHISYTDGVPAEKVNAIVKKYQYGHFDGMNDIYENDNFRTDIAQAKYIMVNRDISEKARESVKNMLIVKFGMKEVNDEECQKVFGNWAADVIYKESRELTFI